MILPLIVVVVQLGIHLLVMVLALLLYLVPIHVKLAMLLGALLVKKITISIMESVTLVQALAKSVYWVFVILVILGIILVEIYVLNVTAPVKNALVNFHALVALIHMNYLNMEGVLVLINVQEGALFVKFPENALDVIKDIL